MTSGMRYAPLIHAKCVCVCVCLGNVQVEQEQQTVQREREIRNEERTQFVQDKNNLNFYTSTQISQ